MFINYAYTFSWARFVSDLFSPPVVWGVFVVPLMFKEAPTAYHALLWVSIYVVLVCLLPITYIVMMVRRGHITDIHMKVRRQRIKPLMVSIACTWAAWVLLRLMNTPSLIPLFVLFSLVQLAIMILITLVWQISIHAISISGVTVATGAFFGLTPALLTMPLIVLVGAARLKLKRHTPAQVVAGTLVGGIVTFALFMAAF